MHEYHMTTFFWFWTFLFFPKSQPLSLYMYRLVRLEGEIRERGKGVSDIEKTHRRSIWGKRCKATVVALAWTPSSAPPDVPRSKDSQTAGSRTVRLSDAFGSQWPTDFFSLVSGLSPKRQNLGPHTPPSFSSLWEFSSLRSFVLPSDFLHPGLVSGLSNRK